MILEFLIFIFIIDLKGCYLKIFNYELNRSNLI